MPACHLDVYRGPGHVHSCYTLPEVYVEATRWGTSMCASSSEVLLLWAVSGPKAHTYPSCGRNSIYVSEQTIGCVISHLAIEHSSYVGYLCSTAMGFMVKVYW